MASVLFTIVLSYIQTLFSW